MFNDLCIIAESDLVGWLVGRPSHGVVGYEYLKHSVQFMSCLSFKVEIHFPNANVSENVDSFPDNGLQVQIQIQIQIVFLKLLRSQLVMILMNQKKDTRA